MTAADYFMKDNLTQFFRTVWRAFGDTEEHERAGLLQREQAARADAEAARERLHVTLASIGDAVITTSAQGTVTFLNKVAESLTGWTTEEASGRPLAEVFHIINEFTREPVEDPVTKVMREGTIVGLANHTALISRTGASTPIDDSGAPIRDSAGAILGIILVFRDVTERKRAEQQIRETEERFRTMANTAPVMIWMSGLHKLCTWFNKPWLDFRGRSMEQELGAGWAEGVHGQDLERCVQIYESSFDARREFRMEYRLQRADGEYRWVLDHGIPRLAHDGAFLGYIGSCIDITDRKRAEEARLQLAAIVESSEDAIIGKTLDGIITSWNPGAERIYGYAAAEIYGRPISLLVPPDRSDELPAIVERLRRGERIAHYETRRIRKDGTEIDISVTISPIRNENGEVVGASAIARDITARKKGEAERAALLERERAARTEAENANRLKDEFLATISHEIRGPLQAILGFTRLLRMGRLDPEQAARAIESVERNARAQSVLIEEILDVSRIITGKLVLDVRPVDIGGIAEAALDVVRPAATAKEIFLHVNIVPGCGLVLADPHRIQQAIWNVLSNAVKFTPRGGKVSLQVFRSESQVRIAVTDTGAGIHPEFLPHIFERFRQAEGSTTRSHGGLGLGLSIVRHVVEMHGGAVEAASEGPGKGATFRISLPGRVDAPPSPSTRRDKDQAEAPPYLLLGLTVLVVDDQPDAREFLAVALRQHGASVHTAGSVAEAIKILQRSRVDVLVSDIAMPEEDGFSLIKKVRSLRVGIPAIALTGFAMEGDRARTLEAGFQMHLSKPLDPAMLVFAVAKLAGRSQ